jgi:outer membrane lipoprotein SlyB
MRLAQLPFALVVGAATLAGCATPYSYPVSETRPVYGPTYVQPAEQYGVVEAIELIRYGESSPINLGTIIGGIAGGVIGHQFGSGRGNTAATIAGAVGGAVVGNEVQKANERDRYRVTVRLDSGDRIALAEFGEGALRVGDRVRVVNSRVLRM